MTEARRKLLARVHLSAKAIGIAEDDYRALLERVSGQRSAGACDDRQLLSIVAELERLGAPKGRSPRRSPPATHPVALKARALWISLGQLGAIGDTSERALEAFAKRQLGVDRLHWADQAQGFRLIEALKAMADRAGWSQAVSQRMPAAERVRVLKARLVARLVVLLRDAGAVFDVPADVDQWTAERLDGAARELAGHLAELRAG